MAEYHSESYLRDWLISIHRQSDGLDFSSIIRKYHDLTNIRPNGRERAKLSGLIQDMVKESILFYNGNEGKTYLKNGKE